MIITIGGPPGSGKTTVARLLSEKLDLELVVIGEIFRMFAREKGLSLAEFGQMAEKNHSIDEELDKKTVEKARKGNLILEGRLAGIMLHKHEIYAYKVWLDADIDERVKRIAGRDGGHLPAVRNSIKDREKSEKRRYEIIYEVSLKDHGIYDLVIDTTDKTPEGIVDIIMENLKV